MKAKLLKLRQQLAETLGKEEALLDKLIKEGREANREEAKELADLDATKKAARDHIARLEQMLEDRARAEAEEDGIPYEGRGITPRPEPAGGRGANERADSSRIIFRDAVSGAEYRALRRGEPLLSSYPRDEQLSLGKILRGKLLGDWSGAAEERDALSGLSGPGGGFLLPASVSSMVIDAARNQARVVEAGALSITVPDRDVTICRVVQDAAASYKQENALASDTSLEFSPIALHPRTLVAYATLSQEILQDAVNLESVVSNALGEALALEMDRAALFGTGAGGEPLGLYETPGINAVLPDANGFSLADYDEFSSAIQKIEDANGVAVAAIFSPRTAAALRELKETANNQYINAPEFFARLRRFTTNQVPNNLVVGTAGTCSAAFVGDFSQFLFALRQTLRIEVSETAGEAWGRYQYKIRATMRFDCVTLRPAHFSVIKGIKP